MEIDNPLLEALSSKLLTTSISSLLDPNGNLFEDILDETGKYCVKFLENIGDSDFVKQALDHGIEGALEAYAAKIFSASALEDIHSAGGIANIISGRTTVHDLGGGVTVREVHINDNESFILDSQDKFIGLKQKEADGWHVYSGEFYTDIYGTRLIRGTERIISPNGDVVSEISVNDGLVTTTRVTYGPEGEEWIEIRRTPTGYFDIDGYDITDAVIEFSNGTILFVDDGEIQGMNINLDSPTAISDITVEIGSNQDPIQYLLLNGLNGVNVPEGTIGSYFDPNTDNNFVASLEAQGVPEEVIRSLALFDQSLLTELLTQLENYQDADLSSFGMAFEAFQWLSAVGNLFNLGTLLSFLQNPQEQIQNLAERIFGAFATQLENSPSNKETLLGLLNDGLLLGISQDNQFVPTSDEIEISEELDSLSESQPDDSYVPVAISGATSMLWTEANQLRSTGEYANTGSLIMIGGVSLDALEGIIPGIDITLHQNPNIQQVINIYGSDDFVNVEITREWLEERIDAFFDGLLNREVTTSYLSRNFLVGLLGPLGHLVPEEFLPTQTVQPFQIFSPVFDRIKASLKSAIDELPLDELAGKKLLKTNYGVNTINIELEGVDHHGYMRMPGQTYSDDDPVKLAEEIIAIMSKRAGDGEDIELILTGAHVNYDATLDTYTVTDLKGFRDALL